MTTFEHAIVGACGALACRLEQRWGWRVATMAAVAANLPDWDGVTFLFNMDWFATGHRLWGHNIWVSTLVAGVWALLDDRYDVMGRVRAGLARWVKMPSDLSLPERSPAHRWVWIATAIAASWSHLPADLVVSGGTGIAPWPIRPWWPVHSQSCTCPCISWGDPSLTLIFAAFGIAIAKWPKRVTGMAMLCLLTVMVWIVIRGTLR
jgi:membrane-bound metal-dependent hydrolase YbcI (DUF457 family)